MLPLSCVTKLIYATTSLCASLMVFYDDLIKLTFHYLHHCLFCIFKQNSAQTNNATHFACARSRVFYSVEYYTDHVRECERETKTNTLPRPRAHTHARTRTLSLSHVTSIILNRVKDAGMSNIYI